MVTKFLDDIFGNGWTNTIIHRKAQHHSHKVVDRSFDFQIFGIHEHSLPFCDLLLHQHELVQRKRGLRLDIH